MTDGIRIHTLAKTSPEHPMGSCVVSRSCYHVTFLCCWLLTMPLRATVQCLLCRHKCLWGRQVCQRTDGQRTRRNYREVRPLSDRKQSTITLRLYVHSREELTPRNGPSYSCSQQLLPPTKRLCFHRCPSVGWLVCKQDHDHTKTAEQNSMKLAWSMGLSPEQTPLYFGVDPGIVSNFLKHCQTATFS